jgi:GrpB-like predicted nucleotidyltransferase (UPF0157 family)
VAFRDWLTTHEADRLRYAAMKQQLSTRLWSSGMAYNNEKAPLIYDLYERIFAADPAFPHDPQPRPSFS